ncbi:MAG: gliding motility lipoprotein GldH [Chlorobi bacterium]|nr:gliding motility lipoprotein GldH [Chlorobiota bacterium]
MKRIIFVFLATIFLFSCANDTVYKEYRKFDNLNWDRFNILNFNVNVEKGQSLDFDLLLRHHTNYPYNFLDANITFYTPAGATLSRDYHFDLKDKKGKWKADGLGDYWDMELPIRKGMRISKAGIMKVRVENKMTKINTPGIMEIGLKASLSN